LTPRKSFDSKYYTKRELEKIGEIVISKNFFVISDEIYEKIIYDGNEHISIGSLSDKLFEQTITVNGVSKSYAMTGWRIGYTGASKEIIGAMEKLQGHHVTTTSSISQAAALEALTGPQDSVTRMVEEFRKLKWSEKERDESYLRGADYLRKIIRQIN
jgi:aspartate aminotransferase